MKKLLVISVSLISATLFSFVSAYSEEQINAYEYAFNNGITTVNNIDKANLNGGITRIEMAKMMSNYAINILGLKPDTSLRCFFYDVDPSINAKYDNGITKICQLGLMGILDDGSISDYFNPSNTVTRGQRATIFSRALNKSRGEDVIEGDPFYKPHLKNLYKKGLIQNVKVPSPTSIEKRGNVLIMMYRTDPHNRISVDYDSGTTKLKAGQIYRNEHYGFEILSTRKHRWIVDIDTGGLIYFCNFLEKKYENITINKGYEEDFRKKAQDFGENGLINCTDLAYQIVKKGGSEDSDLSSEIEEGYLGSPYKKIDLNNGYVAFEYLYGWGQELQYEYERGKYKELSEIIDLGFKKDGYQNWRELYESLFRIEATEESLHVYDDFKLQPIQNNNDKLYQILNNDRVKIDLSKERNLLETAYKQMISAKNKLKKWEKQFLIDNPDFNINNKLIRFKNEAKKIIDNDYSSSPLEKLTAIKFFEDEFGVYLVNDVQNDYNYAYDPELDELAKETIKEFATNH